VYILIAGAGLVGRGLAAKLVEAKHDVVAIDADRRVCEWVATRLGILAVQGSATDVDILQQAGAEKADVAVGSMASDADNLAFCVLAQSYGIPQVLSRMRDPRYQAAYEKAGVHSTIHVIDTLVNQLLLEVEAPHLRQVATFGGGKASIVVDTLPADAAAAGKTIRQIADDEGFPAECIVTGIYRPATQEFIIPRGGATLAADDRIFLVAETKQLRKAAKFLHRTK
jgi:trk system potassium uptake protein TrkA